MISHEEVLSRYGKIPLKFTSYYKYSFSFAGQTEDGTRIKMAISGQDEIYRLEVRPDAGYYLDEATWYQVIGKGEKLIAEWSGY